MMKFIKNFFRPKKKGKVLKVLKVTPEILEKVDIALKRELGLKEAEIQELREELEKFRKKLAKYEGKETEEEKIVKDLLKQKIKIERAKQGRRQRVNLPKLCKIVTYDNKLYTDGRQPYPYLTALEMEETESGFGYNLILKSKNKKNESRAYYRLPLEMIFVEPEHLVAAMKYGIVRTRFDSKGVFHPPKFMKKPCSECEFSGDYYKSLSSISKKYEDRIAQLNEEIDSLRSKLKDTRIREVSLLNKIKDAKNAKDIADFRADLTEGFTAAQIEKMRAMMTEYKTLLLSAQESEVNRVLTHKLNVELRKANQEMAKKLGVQIPDEVEKRIRERVIDEIKKDLNLFWKLSPGRVEVTKETLPPGTKKQEKVTK